jgi:hypothetical protein
MRSRRTGWAIVFCALGAFVALTDAFVMLPVVAIVGWQLAGGGGRGARALLRDRIFLAGIAAIAVALAIDIVIGVIAHRRGSGLTMISYVLVRGGSGIVPSAHVIRAWLQGIDDYFPFRGAWIVVLVAFVAATVAGLRGNPIGAVAGWFAIASIGLVRYAGAMEAINPASVPGFLNAYFIAPPSLLLVAWLLASIGQRRWSMFVTIATLALAAAMARQAWHVAFTPPPGPDIGPNRLVRYTDMPLSACRTVKAAAFYVRSHEKGQLPYVFHLASDAYVGHIGEFYYGLSYTRSSNPEDPNHLLDFGWQQFARHVPPERFYAAYGVPRFDYYIEFSEERTNSEADRPFAIEAAERLRREGAHVVCTIWDESRIIGRILSFRNETPIDLEYRVAAAAWDRVYGRPDRLLQQPLAGSSYHFGYNWRPPE